MRRSEALALATGALAAALAAEAAKAHIPGDVPEAHEDNTFGLPQGDPLRKKLRRFFQDQLKRVVGHVGKLGAEIPAVFPRMADYNDPMASAMTPILGAYWDKSGKALRGRLGLDPDEWRVTDPNVHQAIARAALQFCRATNAKTDQELGQAREAVRNALAQGLVEQGESIPELTRRIRGIFKDAETWRARRIAQTEASRAVHAASEMSAIHSGVVAAKRILLSANSCPTCVAIADKAKAIPLGESFGRVGNNPVYSEIRMPPIHPHCRCSVLYDLVDEAKPPVPAVVPPSPTPPPGPPQGPNPKKPKPTPPPGKPRASAAPATPPAGPILPDRPIEERLKAYTEGDRKVAAILKAAAEFDVQAAVDRQRQSTQERRFELLHLVQEAEDDGDKARAAALNKEWLALMRLHQDVAALKRQAILPAIAATKPLPLTVDFKPSGRYDRLSLENRNSVEDAREFLSKVLSQAGSAGIEFKAAQCRKQDSQRAFCTASPNQIVIKENEKIKTIVHEAGHAIDNNLKGHNGRLAGAVAKEFLAYRVGNEVPTRMMDVVPGAGYDPREMGRKDKFTDAFGINGGYYCGKEYGGTHSSEITSMGLELLFQDAEKLAKADPEYCKFILGILDGSLR